MYGHRLSRVSLRLPYFFPGVERQSDIFKCLGDLLITDYINQTPWSADGNNWLFPSIIKGGAATNVGTTLSSWLKLFAPGSSNRAYQASIISYSTCQATAWGVENVLLQPGLGQSYIYEEVRMEGGGEEGVKKS